MPSLAFVNRLHREPLFVLPVHWRLAAEDEVVLFEFIEEVALTPKIVFLPSGLQTEHALSLKSKV